MLSLALALVLAADPNPPAPGEPATAAPRAAAPATLAAVLARGELRVGTPGDYRPYARTDRATGVSDGLDVELVRGLGARLGVAVRLVPTTWATLAPDLAHGRFDLAVGGVSITEDRRAVGVFTRPVVQDGKTALVRCADRERLASLAALDRPEVTIAVNAGGTNERFARTRLPTARLVVHPDNVGVFDLVAAGKVDAMITDAVEARLVARERPALCPVAAPPFEPVEKAWLVAPDPALVAAADGWLAELESDGALARAVARHTGAPPPEAADPLLGARRRIDAIDVQLLALLSRRAGIALEIAELKRARGLPVRNARREAEVVTALQARSAGPLPPAAIARIWERIFEEMRALETGAGPER